MKGVVFNLLEGFVTETFGEEAYEDILDMCPAAGEVAYVGPKTYPDANIFEIVGATCKHLDVQPDLTLRAFGRYAFPKLAAVFPVFTEGHTDAIAFLETVDAIIHVEVAKLMEGSVLPKMTFGRDEYGDLTIAYRSERGLCHLMEGLLEGVGDFFGQPLSHRQTACAHDGAEACTFEVRRAAPEGSSDAA